MSLFIVFNIYPQTPDKQETSYHKTDCLCLRTTKETQVSQGFRRETLVAWKGWEGFVVTGICQVLSHL